MVYQVKSGKRLDQVCEDLQTAVTNRQFGVLGVHDLKATMAKKGVDFARECRIFEVCNPQQAKRVLAQNMAISTALPCRISVFEEGGGVVLATTKPTALLEMFQEEGLGPVAEEVERVMVDSMEEAAG